MQKLTGLVVCGGQSSRMGTDKSMLDYHGKPQRYHLYEWLQQFCEEVYISCNAEQCLTIQACYKTIVDMDAWKDMGPMTGLLSAHATLPGANFLVVGCDYPLLAAEDIQSLTGTFHRENKTAAYRNADGFIEPLVAIYKSSGLANLAGDAHRFGGSLSKFLHQLDAVILNAAEPTRLKSVDTAEEFNVANKSLKDKFH